MTAKLHLLCHGATAATRSSAFPADEPLEPGEAARLADLAGRLPRFDRVFVAPSRAAAETAAALGLAGETVAALADLDFGRWRGRRLADVAAREADAVSRWMGDPTEAPPGGESVAALIGRVAAWLAAPAPRGRALAVTHAAVVRAAILHVVAAPATGFWTIDAGPATTVELSHDGRRWRLRLPAP